MVTTSESSPGQFAAAIRKADPRSRVTDTVPGALIGHGHEAGNPEEPAWPEHLLGRKPEPAPDNDIAAATAQAAWDKVSGA